MLLPDGYSTILNILWPNLPVTLFIREKELQPPALDLGGGIETSTMRNARMRTFAAKSLLTLGELTLMCQYDPGVYGQMLTIVAEPAAGGVGGLVGVRTRMGAIARMDVIFPDASILRFYGWVDKIAPPSHKEGDFPLMEIKIVPGNRNSTSVGAPEFVPVFIPGALPGAIGR